jgi:hypothetical protein
MTAATLLCVIGLESGLAVATNKAPAATASSSSVWSPKKLADGQPDLQGFWRTEHIGTYSLNNPRQGQDGAPDRSGDRAGLPPVKGADGVAVAKTRKPSRIIDPADGQVPYLPWGRAHQQDLYLNFANPKLPQYVETQVRCFPSGVARQQWWNELEIRQYPGVVMLISYASNRLIYLDNRPHIPENIKLFMSDSRGHWEGNTLVVDVTNSNAKHRLSYEGDFSTDKVHITERFKFLDQNTYQYEATFDDPSVYTQPWTVSSRQDRVHKDDPAWEWYEYACHEGERNLDNYIPVEEPN